MLNCSGYCVPLKSNLPQIACLGSIHVCDLLGVN